MGRRFRTSRLGSRPQPATTPDTWQGCRPAPTPPAAAHRCGPEPDTWTPRDSLRVRDARPGLGPGARVSPEHEVGHVHAQVPGLAENELVVAGVREHDVVLQQPDRQGQAAVLLDVVVDERGAAVGEHPEPAQLPGLAAPLDDVVAEGLSLALVEDLHE